MTIALPFLSFLLAGGGGGGRGVVCSRPSRIKKGGLEGGIFSLHEI